MNVPSCSKCKAAIVWVATRNGKMQPLDAEPNVDGNVRMTGNYRATEKGGILPESAVITKDEAPSLFGEPIERFMPHHATCPFADEFRKPKVATS